MRSDNPYLAEIHKTLPRLLALYDTDVTSPTWGLGDRFYWSWKLIDFGNASFQGAAHGLARLLHAGLLPAYLDEKVILVRIDAMFSGARRLTRKNGSLEEAFPHESSFCVTALVAYDLLAAVELLGHRLDGALRTSYLAVVRPMIKFLLRANETHGIISNHLATAVAALVKWQALTGEETESRAKVLLDVIHSHSSAEGWFREYEGADPGYQSLCIYYLADVDRMRPDWGLRAVLGHSVRFLSYFAHPDGSFGGNYGSRNTRFYFPAGVEALSADFPHAAGLASVMRGAIHEANTVTLSVMDEPNLVPMFNAYCWAAVLYDSERSSGEELLPPAFTAEVWRHHFSDAGLFIDKGLTHYTVISWRKGGVCYHFTGDGESSIDSGAVAKDARGRLYSTQADMAENFFSVEGDELVIEAPFVQMRRELPTPMKFVVLRLLNLTLMRSLTLGNLVKSLLVKLLVTAKVRSRASNRRTIHLGRQIVIQDDWTDGDAGLSRNKVPGGSFSAIHMASQGYWQRQDGRVRS